MDRNIAEHLLSEFERQFTMVRVDKSKFLNALLKTQVSESSRFYEEIPINQQQIPQNEEELGRYTEYHNLSLRRVLRNKNAGKANLAELKRYWEYVAETFGFYSYNILSRNLRRNKDLVEMTINNKSPFSLLGEFESNDMSGEDTRVITRPVLIIPDAEDLKIIGEWEEANKIYEEEIGFLFKSRRRINPQEYSS